VSDAKEGVLALGGGKSFACEEPDPTPRSYNTGSLMASLIFCWKPTRLTVP